MGNERDSNSIRSVMRAIDVLDGFIDAGPYMSFTEIANISNLPKATAYRVIETLKEKEYLVFDEEKGTYKLGYKLIQLGNIALSVNELRSNALPIMKKLMEMTGETVTLFIRQKVWKVCIEKVESMHEFRLSTEIGKVMPIYVGASGKVILSDLSRDEFDEVISEVNLFKLTKNTITDPEELWKVVRQTAENGYAVSYGERVEDSFSIGAPIRDNNGKICASLNITGPLYRLNEDKTSQFIKYIVDASNKVSLNMGYKSKS